MPSIKKFATQAALAFAALFMLQTQAMATAVTQPASMCRVYAGTQDAQITYEPGLIYNNGNNTAHITCPIVRSQEAVNGMTVFLDGNIQPGYAINCWVMSYSYQNTTLAGVSFTAGSGSFDRALHLTAAQAPMWSTQAITCELPVRGMLYDVEVLY